MTSSGPLQPALRILDANLNRACEGLRVLEDIARLALNNADLSQKLKAMRHELVTGDLSFNTKLIEARDSVNDVGADTEVAGQEKEKELPLVVVANARRAQESLRTIEELAKTGELPIELHSENFKQARFNLYTVERELISSLLRHEKAKRITGLHAIIDTQALAGRNHAEIARQVIQGGAKAIQLRDKATPKKYLLPIAEQLRALCREQEVIFIVNDHIDLALATNADGVHLGQDDLPLKAARKLLSPDKLLGISTHSLEEAIAAEADGADYIGVGSMYPTMTKEAAIVIGLDSLRRIRHQVKLPLVAIGGITKDNAGEVIAAGADSVAVISAILGAESPEESAKEITTGIEA